MSNKQFGLIDNWVRHIKDVYHLHRDELNAIVDEESRARRFVELNVIEQVYDLGKTSIIQNAWRHRQMPYIHGWAYDIREGLVKDLSVSINDDSTLEQVYKMD